MLKNICYKSDASVIFIVINENDSIHHFKTFETHNTEKTQIQHNIKKTHF